MIASAQEEVVGSPQFSPLCVAFATVGMAGRQESEVSLDKTIKHVTEHLATCLFLSLMICIDRRSFSSSLTSIQPKIFRNLMAHPQSHALQRADGVPAPYNITCSDLHHRKAFLIRVLDHEDLL